MKFHKVIGDFPLELVRKAQEKLTKIFTELSLRYDNYSVGTGMGGDPLLFNLVCPVVHICTDTTGKSKLRTAATDGKKYYWNPYFVDKLSKIGLRIVVSHEAWHAIYMHPQRRGARNPRLWNIAVDFKVNSTIIEDFKSRGVHKDSEKLFRENLGDFITLEEYGEFLKDPFNPPARIAHLNPMRTLYMTPEEMDQFEAKYPPMYFADGSLKTGMKRPENIYDYFYNLLPRCAECGTVGKYKYPKLTPEVAERKRTFQQRMGKEVEKTLLKKKEELEKQLQSEQDEEKKKALENEIEDVQDLLKKLKEKLKKLKPQKDEYLDNQSHDCSKHDHSSEKPSKKNEETSDDQEQQEEEQEQEEDRQGEEQEQGQESGEEDGDGNQQGQSCGNGGCKGCGKGAPQSGKGQGGGEGDDFNLDPGDQEEESYDPFNAGQTLDDHIDADMSEEELGRRISDAIEATRKMAGKVPGGLEDELGTMIAPKLTWQDFIRMVVVKAKEGKGRNDWTKPKARPMFAGIYNPKQRRKYVKILVGIDTSGSMGKDDMAFGVSQLQVIDENGEGVAVPWDTQPYWEAKTELKKFDMEKLSKIKIKGRGGTEVSKLFNEYQDKDKIGEVDLIIIITDSYLYDGELKNAKAPKCPVVWLVTAHNDSFKPPFGRVFHLRND